MTEKAGSMALGALMAEPKRAVEQHGWKVLHALAEVFPMGFYCMISFGILILFGLLVLRYLRMMKVLAELQLPIQTQK